MIPEALASFALAALIGIFMAIRHKAGNPPPRIVAHLHGLFAAGGVVLVLVTLFQGALPTRGVVGLVALVAAALGGATLSGIVYAGRKVPFPLVLVHATIAVAGVALVALSLSAPPPTAAPEAGTPGLAIPKPMPSPELGAPN